MKLRAVPASTTCNTELARTGDDDADATARAINRGERPAPGVEVGAAAAVSDRPGAGAPSLAGLAACVEDARKAAGRSLDGPAPPTSFAALRARLERAAASLPPLYRRAVAEPLLRSLRQMGPEGLVRVLAEDPGREGEARLLLDVAQAVLQRGEGYQPVATAAFQEVVSDLYDGFLSAEDRRGVKPPDHGVIPPIVRWGASGDGPYTWPVTAAEALGVGTAVVSLPAANAESGLLAWPALAHETAGHDVLAADAGLREELARVVERSVRESGSETAVARYWAERIDEAAADVLGVLNMGPAAAVGLTGYLRAMNGAMRGRAQLRNVGAAEDPHPADLARAYLAAETVRLLSFRGASAWADRLVAEADRDLGRIWLGRNQVGVAEARASAAAVARAVVRTRLGALEGHALGEIQDWKDRDEARVAALRADLRSGESGGSRAVADGTWAAHAVAAAVYEAAAGSTAPGRAMEWMLGEVAAMHRENPAWAEGSRRGPAEAGGAAA